VFACSCVCWCWWLCAGSADSAGMPPGSHATHTAHATHQSYPPAHHTPGSLPPALAALPSLVFLDVHSNQLGGDLSPYASTLVSNGSVRLIYSDLSANQFQGGVPKDFARAPVFASSLPVNLHTVPAPRLLDLSNNSFSGDFPLWLLQAIPAATNRCRCLVPVAGEAVRCCARMSGLGDTCSKQAALKPNPPLTLSPSIVPPPSPPPSVNGPDASLFCPTAAQAGPYTARLPEDGTMLELYNFNCTATAGGTGGADVDLLSAMDGSQSAAAAAQPASPASSSNGADPSTAAQQPSAAAAAGRRALSGGAIAGE